MINLVLSCYVKGRNAPSAQMTLEQLDQEFPDRKAACQCFKRELDKVSNRTIFVDSYRSNQLRKAVEMARRQGDGRQLQQMQQQMKSYQTFMQSILTSCR